MTEMGKERQHERRRQRVCPSCGGTSMIRGCKVPGVQLQIVKQGGEPIGDLISLYSDVCVDCGLTSFYARRAEVAGRLGQNPVCDEAKPS